jgi:agmatinase
MDTPLSFLELGNSTLDEAEVAVIRVPFEGTVSYGKGTSAAPDAILRASWHLETFDEELEFEHEGAVRYCVLPAIVTDANERVEAYLNRVTRVCAGYGLAPPFYLGLGGEHSVTSALLKGILKQPDEVTVVQIDAHADLREEYQGSRFNHACAMRRVLELGVKKLVAIGIRSAEKSEYELAREDPRIETYYDHELAAEARFEELLERLRGLTGPIHLTIDADGLDCSLCPGTGTPQPGGLSWAQTLAVLRALIAEGEGELLGADLCEAVPQPSTRVNEQTAAKLAFKIVGYRFAPRRD